MKKTLSVLLAVLIFLCTMPVMALADDETFTYGSFTYTVKDEEATITQLDQGVTGSVIIPSRIDGYPVTQIGENAFSGCSLVTAITLPVSVKALASKAFSGLTNLDRFDFSGTLIQWCAISFKDGSSVPFGITDNVYIDNSPISQIPYTALTGITKIGAYSFYNCATLMSIGFPSSLNTIGNYAFYGNDGLTQITIPASVSSIGVGVFNACSNLENIEVALENPFFFSSGNCVIERDSHNLIIGTKNSIIPDDGSVIQIGNSAFRDCVGLARITIPEGVTVIKGVPDLLENGATQPITTGAFSGCIDLEEVILPESMRVIGTGAFYGCVKLSSVNLPYGLTEIHNAAFMKCESLSAVTIPENVTVIGRFSFRDCSGLIALNYNAKNAELKAKKIAPNIFHLSDKYIDWLAGCTSLDTLVFGKTVEVIPPNAFYNINTINTITIRNTVKTIDESSFEYCDKFSRINFYGTPEEWIAGFNSYFVTTSYVRDIYYLGGICTKTDEQSQVSVQYEYGTFGTPNDGELNLDVDDIAENDTRFSAFKAYIDGVQLALYEIHIKDADDVNMQPVDENTVTVKIPLPFNITPENYNTVFIHHRKADGTTERIKYVTGDLVIEDGFFKFDIDSFSDFAVCADDEGNHIDENGDHFCDLCGESLTYSVKLIVDGVNLGNVIYHYGDTEIDNLPDVPEKPGYTGEWDYTITGSELEIRPAYTPITYYATFMADGKQVGGKVPFTVESTSITAPNVPAKEGYTGKWSEYTLALCDITIQAIYEKIPDNTDNPDIPGSSVNPTASAKIKVKSDSVYKNSKVTVTAKAEGVPKGYYLAVFDGKTEVERGTNSSVTYEIKELVSRDKKLTVKVIDKDGNVQKNAKGEKLTDTINITVKTGFFDAIIAFFKKLFGSNKAYISA